MEVGEGAVAVVRVSRRAGWTVTVLPDGCSRALKRKKMSQEMGTESTTRGRKSDVETNTERFSKHSSSAGCDVRYASSNRLANGLKSPLYRQTSSFSSPSMDHFVQSLRQYPVVTSSAEFIQRVLHCAQTRNHRSIYPSKSMQSLLRRSTSQQTNRISKRCGYGGNAAPKVSSGRPFKRSASIGEKCSSQEELLNYTYDYLKKTSLLRRRTDVRYITDMKRALKDRLQTIIDGKPTVCPKIQSRYDHHKKHCEGNGPEHTINHNRHKVCSCTSRKPYGLDTDATEHKLQDLETKRKDERDYQMILNTVKDWMKNVPVYPNFSIEDKTKQVEITNELAKLLTRLNNQSHFNFKAKKEILECLSGLPMWHPEDLIDDPLFKERLVDNLIQKLTRNPESDFVEHITKGIKELSLDSVGTNSDDIKTIIEKFTSKLKLITDNHPSNDDDYKEALKSVFVDLFKELPLQLNGGRTELPVELANKFAKRLSNIKIDTDTQITALDTHDLENDVERIIFDWCNTSEILKLNIPQHKVQSLVEKIRKYKPETLKDSNVQKKMQVEIKEWLDKAAVKTGRRLDIKKKNEVTKKLMQLLMRSNNGVNKSEFKNNGIFPGKNLPILLTWFRSIPELSEGDKSETRKALQNLATQIEDIQLRDEDFQNIQVDMREVITNWLQNMQRIKHKALDSVIEENLVNKLVLNLNDLPKQRRREQSGDLCYSEVIEWLNNISGKSFTHMDQNYDIQELLSTLNYIKNNSDEKVQKKQTKDAVKCFIENLTSKTGLGFDLKDRKLLEQKILRRMNLEPHQMAQWNNEINFSQESSDLQSVQEFLSSTPKAYALRHHSMTTDVSPISDISPLNLHSNEQSEYALYKQKLKNAIRNWVNDIDLNIKSADLNNLISDVASDVVDRQKYLQLSEHKTSEADELEHLKYQIFRRLNKLNNIELLPKIISEVNRLNKLLLTVKVPELTQKSLKCIDKDVNLKRNIDNLVNSLQRWLKNIPFEFPGTHNKSYTDEIILDLAKKLAALERDNNNNFYVDNEVLQHLPKFFTNLDEDMLNNLGKSLKKHLMNDYLTNLNGQEDTTEPICRKILWDTISKTLPSIKISSEHDLKTFNSLKERLVDAFINLHYFANDYFALDKFKTKLLDEINKFCIEYLKRNPDSSLTFEDLSKNLYNALNMVSLPNITTIRSDHDQVRLREEITEWVKDVPLTKSENTESETNRMIFELAKNLHEIERDKNRKLNKKAYSEMKLAIMNWLQKLPIKNRETADLQKFTDNLIDKLKTTNKSRTLSISNLGRYYDTDQRRDTITLNSPQSPQNTLTVKDRAHLERIRKRVNYTEREYGSKDAFVNPLPIGTGIQTDRNSKIEGTVQTSQTSLFERCSLNREISPQVIIKEFYWDSIGSNQSLIINTPTTVSPHPSVQVPLTESVHQTTRTIRTKDINTQTEDDTQQTLDNTAHSSRFPSVIAPWTMEGIDHRAGNTFERQIANLGSPDDGRIIPKIVRSPDFYLPKDRCADGQLINLSTENMDVLRKKRYNICSNCDERMLAKNRRRPHSGCRQQYKMNCLKYCSNCCSGCPYPSQLYFRKEF